MHSRARCFIYHPETDSILLISRFKDNQHYWTVPGGAVLAGETAQAAVAREVADELGLRLAVHTLRVLTHVIRRGDPETYFTCDLPTAKSFAIQAVESARDAPDNRAQPEWVPRTEVVTRLPYLTAVAQLASQRLRPNDYSRS